MTSATLTSGVSDAAQFIADTTQRNREHMDKSLAVGFERILRGELTEVWEECKYANWDGYDALPVSEDAFRNMQSFLEALPLGFPRPTIGADPHGHLSVEWYRSLRRVLSVAVSDDELLHYAALLGSNKTCGTETFYDEVPESILSLVRRVYS
ncbi:MAG: hypothetical protein IID36_00025 [Planctomycetes bacterium]|nr:hypothetical protein [Planctomycetota bacterium]